MEQKRKETRLRAVLTPPLLLFFNHTSSGFLKLNPEKQRIFALVVFSKCLANSNVTEFPPVFENLGTAKIILFDMLKILVTFKFNTHADLVNHNIKLKGNPLEKTISMNNPPAVKHFSIPTH
tara:strand:+ start:282 stop:647 length:366 start_codon:yes stop_codon:yes gene_type:complete